MCGWKGEIVSMGFWMIGLDGGRIVVMLFGRSASSGLLGL
jgi:hypothetical protein